MEIVGASPQASLLPIYTAGTSEPLANSLERLRKAIEEDGNTVDVVNMSMGIQENTFDVFFASAGYLLDEIVVETGLPQLQSFDVDLFLENAKFRSGKAKKVIQIITRLTARNDVFFVASAGNDGSLDDTTSLTANFPSVIPWVLSVGAYDYNEKRAVFIRYVSSNFGSHVDLWAPGEDLFARTHNYLPNEAIAEWKWQYLEGTSFAAPQVAGAVALIKSLKTGLKFNEIKEILQTTARHPSSANKESFLPLNKDYPIYFLDALKAIQHPKLGAKPADAYNLKVASQGYLVDYERRVPSSGNSSSNLTNSTVSLFEGSLSNYPEIKDGDCVKVIGWTRDQQSRVPFGQVKPLSIEKDPNPPLKCNESFRTQAIPTGSNAPTTDNPFSTQSIAFPQSTSYIKVTLSGDSQSQKLYLRNKDLDGNSTATASLSDSPEQHEAQANKVALGTDFTEVGTLSGTQTVIIAVTNSGNTSDFYTVEMALAPTGNRRVVLQATSSFSMGATDPVQVVLRLKDSQGKPANGRHRIPWIAIWANLECWLLWQTVSGIQVWPLPMLMPLMVIFS